MTTFGLRVQESHSFSLSNVNPYSVNHSDSLLSGESSFPATGNEKDEDEEVEPTQAQSQLKQTSFNPIHNEALVGVLTFLEPLVEPRYFHLRKDHPSRQWTLGRGKDCSIIIPDNQISTHHCTLVWNGKLGQRSEVTLVDTSTNGTTVGNRFLQKGTAILHSGTTICLANIPNGSLIFQDIEGMSARHAPQVWSKYDIGVELGRGAFAKVNHCVERATGNEFAVKIIELSKVRRTQSEKNIKREAAILHELSQFRHENVVALYESFEEVDCLYLILERLRGGDLLSYILNHGPLPEERVRHMAAQMCQAIAYVHQKGVTHRDLKPENVLLTDTQPIICKIADFGLAKIVDDQTFLKTTCGTPVYLAPEVVLRSDQMQAYDNKVDSWSLGVIVFCMLTKQNPFDKLYDTLETDYEKRQYFMRRKIHWDILNTFSLSQHGHDFIRRLLTDDPRRRYSVERMLDHPWISEFVPSYSKIFPFQDDSEPPASLTDSEALVCSQSFQQLHLSDGSAMPIPGLASIIPENNTPNNMEPTPPPLDIHVPSYGSELSLTTNMPGAFPKARNTPVVLPALAEGDSGNLIRNPDSAETLKGKKYLIAGDSPLSSLTSEEDDEEDSEPPEQARAASFRRQRPDSKRKRRDDSPPPNPAPTKARRPPSGNRKTTKEAPIRKSTRTRSSKKV